jgi:ribonuclease HI
MLTLYFDGSFKKVLLENPGDQQKVDFICYGWLIFRDSIAIAQGFGGFLENEDSCSNAAEYFALIEGLEALGDMGVKDELVLIFGDSRLVIDQMLGFSSVSSARIQRYYYRALKLSSSLLNLDWEWIPRKYNRAADQLTRHVNKRICAGKTVPTVSVEIKKELQSRGKKSSDSNRLFDLRIFQSSGIGA